MKKLFTITSLLTVAINASLLAQPVITNGNNPLPFGTSVPVSGGVGTIQPGNGGANITWDFSTLTLTQQATATIMDPAATPYPTSFPTSTQCYQLTPTGGSAFYVYEKISANKYEQVANNYTGAGSGTDYTPNPESYLQFPFHYNDSFIDTFQKTTTGPETVTITYDAYWHAYYAGGHVYKCGTGKKILGPGRLCIWLVHNGALFYFSNEFRC